MPLGHPDSWCDWIGVFVQVIDRFGSCDCASDFDRRDEAAVVVVSGGRGAPRNYEDLQNKCQEHN